MSRLWYRQSYRTKTWLFASFAGSLVLCAASYTVVPWLCPGSVQGPLILLLGLPLLVALPPAVFGWLDQRHDIHAGYAACSTAGCALLLGVVGDLTLADAFVVAPVLLFCWACGTTAGLICRSVSARFYHIVIESDPRCMVCGYDLTGNVSGRCPECGTPIDPAESEAEQQPMRGCNDEASSER